MIKVTTKIGKKEIDFPRLMETKEGIVALMTSCTEGTVIIDNEHKMFGVGRWWSAFDASKMTDYNGAIELSNTEMK